MKYKIETPDKYLSPGCKVVIKLFTTNDNSKFTESNPLIITYMIEENGRPYLIEDKLSEPLHSITSEIEFSDEVIDTFMWNESMKQNPYAQAKDFRTMP